jgi:hypothetical protein
MSRLQRLWRVGKWAGVVLSLVIVMAWAGSLRGSLSYRVIDWRHVRIETTGALGYQQPTLVTTLESGYVVCYYCLIFIGKPGWNCQMFPPPCRWRLTSTYWGTLTSADWKFNGCPWFVVLPIWLPFILVTLPTAFLFYLDRRRIPPHCCQKCGYDLTGNTSGTCPECGMLRAAAPSEKNGV